MEAAAVEQMRWWWLGPGDNAAGSLEYILGQS